MHVLTKIFIVLAALLAMLLSGLAIAYTANTARVLEELESQKAEASASASAQRAAEGALMTVQERLATERESWRSDIETLRAEVDGLASDNVELRAENVQLAREQSSYATRIDQLIALQDAYAQLDATRNQELAELRRREQQALQREIDLLDQLNDVEGRLDVASESNRTLQEQLTLLREELQQISRQGGTATALAAGDRTVPAPANFQARVTDVRRDVNRQQLVSINAGSSDGLRPNMRLLVTRRGRFLANLVVENVNVNDAVARADTLGQEVTIQPGDIILSSNG
ncbi:MAG: hypothetical protein AAGI30_01965 [Planctomycetota bacterium]